MENTPNSYYDQQLNIYQTVVKKHNNALFKFSMLRLAIFLAVVVGIYLTFQNWRIALGIGFLGIIAFIFTVSKYTDIKYLRNLHRALVTINKEELAIASGDFHERPEGLEFQDPMHFYSLDIDLFGKGSFFQFINRTTINEGSIKLAEALNANDINHVVPRQEAIKELADKPNWRQNFAGVATLIHVETPAVKIIEWLKSHQLFLPNIMKWMPLAFSIASLVIVGLSVFQFIPPIIAGLWMFLGLILTGVYLKKINNLATNTDKVKDTFRQYATLLDQIEQETFTSTLLKEKQEQIQLENQKASAIFAKFSKHLDALDNRNNFISAILGNGFLLTDLKNSYKVEQWIGQYNETVAHWFEVVSFFDAYNSLGNYAFNHPEYVFPNIIDTTATIDAKQLGHPLLDAKKRVASDLTIKNQEFFIVTGANMAGKSTFLRTVSLHIVMANVGLPVCATSSNYQPIKLITSMRTSDSLTDDSSYFFSELTRLKFIVDAIQEEPYFIILDEILKGTNSTDKAIGSKKFVEKLVASNATGIIATHDLSLCEIETQLEPVKNYYFDAQIINDELFFDYKFKKGICQNMNASFLLKKMEII
ncbi:DNA mismatch repair protein MutS [Bizionia argentinensis JUB59]|uniref:DNA mismatch repair protein MutS n=1 Tax=Bizionia argentinensis JUB59 TaxID=1046627 RepID=G2EH93_9FLAO|nr:DNA mismatch repair protein MutS [Bizionia argentinensis]EGV42085.1 DNA mismatch repair protein MutS [Bizionia argentinensis JUB59]